MVMNILCLVVGVWLGIFVAGLLAASKRQTEADAELDELGRTSVPVSMMR